MVPLFGIYLRVFKAGFEEIFVLVLSSTLITIAQIQKQSKFPDLANEFFEYIIQMHSGALLNL